MGEACFDEDHKGKEAVPEPVPHAEKIMLKERVAGIESSSRVRPIATMTSPMWWRQSLSVHIKRIANVNEKDTNNISQ